MAEWLGRRTPCNIMQHLDKHNILHDAQHGFRKHRSTETQLIQLINNLAHNIDNKIPTDAILLDFKKAFHKVRHQRLYSTNSHTMPSHHKHPTGYNHSKLTAHSRSSWRALCLPPSMSLLESPRKYKIQYTVYNNLYLPSSCRTGTLTHVMGASMLT